MEYFVDRDSIVRKIWGNSDTVLFVFAGAAAEFALNKAVDWLYFTGKLPSDPLRRLFSTVKYAHEIIFAQKDDALRAIDTIAAIHSAIEGKRGASIPDWAYRDVLFMLIDYSIRSFEVLERKLSDAEKAEVFDVFKRVGSRMGLIGLPETFESWRQMRGEHLQENLQHSHYTDDLFKQYKKHLGSFRFKILIEAQILIMPERVRDLLNFRRFSLLSPVIIPYKVIRGLKLDSWPKAMLLPSAYKTEIDALNRQ